MSEWRTWHTSNRREDNEEGHGGGHCMVGFCSSVHDVDLHGIVRCGAYFSTWHRDGHVVRLALSEGSPGGAMFGNHLRREAAYQNEEASAKGGKKDSVGASDW